MLVGDKRRKHQVLNFLKPTSPTAQAVIDLMDTDPPVALKNIMAVFIDSQVASGNWALMDCFQFYAMDTAANAVINWIGNFSNGLLVNSPVHDPFDGITGDGITQFITTQYNPTDDGINVGQDNLMTGVFCVDNLDVRTIKYLFGNGASTFILMRQSVTPTRLEYFINDSTAGSLGTEVFQDNTLVSVERFEAATKRIRVDAVSATASVASTGFANDDIDVLAQGGANHLNAKVASFYVSASTSGGFDYDNFKTNHAIISFFRFINLS